MISKRFPHLAVLLALVALAFSTVNYVQKPKLAYVRSQELVYGYLGTKEARMKFEAKREQWQANADTLKADFEKEVKTFNEQVQNMAHQEREDRKMSLQMRQRQIMEYTRSLDEKAAKEDEEMMQGVLNQVNSFVEQYGEKKGYDIILGTTLSGSILYGKAFHDITEELLEALNKQYKGGN
jgi:outer membrane protein